MSFVVVFFQRLKMSLRNKVALAFSVILLLFVINGSITLALLTALRDAQQQQTFLNSTRHRLQNYQVTFQSELSVYSEIIFVTKVNIIHNSYRSINLDNIQFENKNYKNDKSVKLAELYLTAVSSFQQLDELIKMGDFSGAKLIWNNYAQEFYGISQFLDNWGIELEKKSLEKDAILNDTFFFSFVTIISFTLLSLLLALFFLVLFQKVFFEPLFNLKASLEKVAEGNLDQKLTIVNRDEIGVLAQSFMQALIAIQKIIRGVKIMESLQEISIKLSQISVEQTYGTSEQSSALTQVTASIEELGHTAKLIAVGANNVDMVATTVVSYIENLNKLGVDNQQFVENGVQVVQIALDGIEQIKGQVTAANTQMKSFSKKTRETTQIVELLESLSREIHILSLNASIEAASAGQYGERFKAIASNVRNLANKANRATQQATSIIDEMRKDIEDVANFLDVSDRAVIDLARDNSTLQGVLAQMHLSATEVRSAVSYVYDQIGILTNEAELIKTSTYQQQLSNEQIISSIYSVKEITLETAKLANTIAIHSANLGVVATQLSGVLNQLQLTV